MNIFIDTQDMEERYGEQLYQDYLVEQNKELQQENTKLKMRIDKATEYLKAREEDNECCFVCGVMSDRLLEILKGDVK